LTQQPEIDLGWVQTPRADSGGPNWFDVAGDDRREPCVAPVDVRVRAGGKFLFAGDEKLYVRGVVYDADPDDVVVPRDLAALAAGGVNAIRTRTTPSRRLLDRAREHGLRVVVGIPADQLVRRLGDGRDGVADIERIVRHGVGGCAGHPAVLGYALGSVPAAARRWHGRRRVARFLENVCRIVRSEDPQGLVTYVNDSTGEFMDLPFFDLVFVELDSLDEEDLLEPCLARLHNLAGDRPLVVGAIGGGQIRTAFSAGCAGVLLDAWTNSHDTVRATLAEGPFPAGTTWPRISVVVCTYNGSRTIRECLDGLSRLDYPDYELIVVDNGSTDDTTSIVGAYPVRLIRTEATGLSDARNTGLGAATGEIVAYLDDDAWPDPHWLKYLAATFARTNHVGVGGPNIPPPGDGIVAECVANSPGNPVHVLLTDAEAEHIPGCNMAFRKSALVAIGGFDARYRAAGDDVDVCWRLQQCGWTLGFSPAAFVWHHCRNTVRAYGKQQFGYGRAEAMLEAKWPEKYNSAGHLSWAGRVYGKPITLGLPARMYCSARGPSMYESAPTQPVGVVRSLPLMPEWYLVIVLLAGLSALGLLWPPLLATLPLLVLAVVASLAQVWKVTAQARFNGGERSRLDTLRLCGLTALLNLIQPLARLHGRLRHGLSPWRRHRKGGAICLPVPRHTTVWNAGATPAEALIDVIETCLRDEGFAVRSGGEHDRWDIEVRAGALGACRVLTAVEDHPGGRQLVRFRTWPRLASVALGVGVIGAVLATFAAGDHAWAAAAVLGVMAAAPVLRSARECAVAGRAVWDAIADSGCVTATLDEGRQCRTAEAS
jgi:GT2 family glycosyltransferase/PAS domain-containing protein